MTKVEQRHSERKQLVIQRLAVDLAQ